MTDGPEKLRALLDRPGLVSSLVAHDAFSALVMEAAGLEMLFVGGFGVAASRLGLPDVGLLTLTDVVEAVRSIARRVSIPVVADGDTGHGDLHNVAHTVRLLEEAGAAGVLLEDQQDPKRCGHFDGQKVIPAEQMLAKLRVACGSRRNPAFAIFARTDARSVLGLDEAIRRMKMYLEAGADVGFIEAPRDATELQRIAVELPGPLLANVLTDGKTPPVPAVTLAEWGYKFMVCPVAGLAATGFALRELTRAVLEDGQVNRVADRMLSFAELKKTVGLDQIEAHVNRFRSAADQTG